LNVEIEPKIVGLYASIYGNVLNTLAPVRGMCVPKPNTLGDEREEGWRWSVHVMM